MPMEFEFKLSDLGEGITEAEIRTWLINPGDYVEEHQPVVEVETDKAVVCPASAVKLMLRSTSSSAPG